MSIFSLKKILFSLQSEFFSKKRYFSPEKRFCLFLIRYWPGNQFVRQRQLTPFGVF
jgi:hypothetical protein